MERLERLAASEDNGTDADAVAETDAQSDADAHSGPTRPPPPAAEQCTQCRQGQHTKSNMYTRAEENRGGENGKTDVDMGKGGSKPDEHVSSERSSQLRCKSIAQ